MKTQIWLVGVVVVGLLGLGAYAIVSKNSYSTAPEAMMHGDEPSIVEDSMMKHEEMSSSTETMEKSIEMMEKSGAYEAYTPEKLALAEKGKVVLFFHASWCPICHSIEKEILANPSAIPASVHLLKVDYDSATELKKKYGVTYQHTFVQVDAQGKQIAKWGDSFTLADVVKRVR